MAQTIPTIGFNVEELNLGPIDLKIWDVGGQSVVRELWSHYMGESSSAVVFVVDSSDYERIDEARKELLELMQSEAASKAVLLVLANKQDLPGALDRAQVAEALHVPVLSQARACSVFEVTAITGEGLQGAMDWLANTLMNSR